VGYLARCRFMRGADRLPRREVETERRAAEGRGRRNELSERVNVETAYGARTMKFVWQRQG